MPSFLVSWGELPATCVYAYIRKTVTGMSVSEPLPYSRDGWLEEVSVCLSSLIIVHQNFNYKCICPTMSSCVASYIK